MLKTIEYRSLVYGNVIMNGGFDLWQRGGISAAVNTTTSYAYSAADRWLHRHTGTFTGTPNVQRDADSPTNNLSTFALRHRFRRNASTALLEHQQRVESIFSKPLLKRGPVSLSLWVKATLSIGSVRVRMFWPSAVDNHATQTQFYDSGDIALSTANAWQQIKLEAITLNSNVANGLAVVVQYSLPSGTDSVDQDFEFTQVQLSSGTQVKDFEPAGGDLVNELQLCQRYYEKSYALDVAPNTSAQAGTIWFTSANGNPGGTTMYFHFTTEKRTTPTCAIYGALGTIGVMRNVSNGTNLAAEIGLTQISTKGAVGSNTATGLGGNVYAFHYTSDAEIN